MADEEEMMKELEAMYVEEDKKKGKKAGKAPKKPATDKAGGAGQDANHDDQAGKKEEAEKKPTTADSGDKNGVAAKADAPLAPAAAAPAKKTEAEKRKEKKEREKAKKAAENAAKKPDNETEAKSVEPKQEQKQQEEFKKPDEAGKVEAKEEKAEDEADGEGAGEGGKSEEKEMSAAKKKKLKKKEKEKEKKAAAAASGGAAAGGGEAKKPTSAVAKLIKQQLEKQREEEEKLRRQEEEAERKRAEERLRREEEERLERERKERRKQKEKERKKRLKEEGKLLTQKQKQDRQRLQQMIQLSSVELPAAAEDGAEQQEQKPAEQQQKKKPKYEKLKRRKPAASQANQQSSEQMPAPIETVKAADDAVPESWEDAAMDTTWDKMETNDEWAPITTPKEKQAGAKAAAEDQDDDEGSSSDGDEYSDDDNDEDESEEEETAKDEDVDPIDRARQRIAKRRETAIANAEASVDSPDVVLRCPLVCVLGHVDTGKTSILDKLRRTHVQDGEAGGITQQIGATNVPAASILTSTRMVKSFNQNEMRLPGLLIIDTPGHESFSNLRSRGSSLCDVAILVVDIMHGIEPQTIESIQLLKNRGTPFIVALNKIDRLYDWQKNANADVFATLKKQSQATNNDFQDRLNQVVAQFAMQELNVCLSNENKNFDDYISLVPTSAHSGDGMGNLMAHICELSLLKLKKRLVYHEDLEATVMEVKEITGLGTTIDVCLVNGKLRESETIVLAGQEGPIVTQIRGLLMPAPMKEMRVKNQYDKFKEVKGAQAVKIIAKDLEKALAGLPLYSTKNADEIEVFKMDVSAKLSKVLKSIEVQDTGVYVQASTLGSLEALLLFLRTEKIPYCGINIGPVHKRDVTKCSIMLEKDPQWAVILAFDVKVEREAQELADSHGVKIFTADIIYHLSDAFIKWRDDRIKAEREKFKDIAVFPCKLRVLPQFIFNSRDPIVCGVIVEAGILKVGTPISVPSKESVYLGRVESLELNHKKVEEARRGAELCIKIAAPPGDAPKMYGRHFDHNDLLMSRVSRESIDALKQYFRDDLGKEDWKLVIELKKAFNVY